MSAVHPFFEFVLQHCHALCHVFVSSEGSSDTPACGPSFNFLSKPHSHIRLSSAQRRSLHLTGVFHSPSSTCAVSAQMAPTHWPQSAKKAASSFVFSLDQSRADGHRKNVPLRGIHKAPLERSSPPLSSCFMLCVFRATRFPRSLFSHRGILARLSAFSQVSAQ